MFFGRDQKITFKKVNFQKCIKVKFKGKRTSQDERALRGWRGTLLKHTK